MPRHLFAPRFTLPQNMGSQALDAAQREEWLRAVYHNEARSRHRTVWTTDAINADSISCMPSVLIRDVPTDDLEQIRLAAADRGVSLQHYLREAILAQAAYLRRREALARTAERLGGRPEVPPEERQAVLDAIVNEHRERDDRLIDRPPL